MVLVTYYCYTFSSLAFNKLLSKNTRALNLQMLHFMLFFHKGCSLKSPGPKLFGDQCYNGNDLAVTAWALQKALKKKIVQLKSDDHKIGTEVPNNKSTSTDQTHTVGKCGYLLNLWNQLIKSFGGKLTKQGLTLGCGGPQPIFIGSQSSRSIAW